MLYFNKPHLTLLFSTTLISLLAVVSCRQEDEAVAVGDPSKVSFILTEQSHDEGEGTVTIDIKLDRPQNVRTVLNFQVGGNATSNLISLSEADYELLTQPPIVIPEGQTSAVIEVRLVEDKNFEPTLEQIDFHLNAILEGNAVLSDDANTLSHTCYIQENEYKLFLEWDHPEGEKVDMSLYVELPNKELLASEGDGDHEELTIVNTQENQQYYVDIWLNKGDTDVKYNLKTLKAGTEQKKTLIDGHFYPEKTNNQEDNRTELLKNHLLIRSGNDLRIL